jgi:signal transduction histidine kinase/ActR/RegA family two-component response regulator
MTPPPHPTSWHETAAGRSRDLRLRLATTLVIAMTASHLVGALWPLVWLTSVTVLQFASLLALQPAHDPQFAMSPTRARFFHGVRGLSSVVFSSIGVVLWFGGGWPGRLCAILLLAGGAIHGTLRARVSSRQLWIVQAPFMVLIAGLPLVSMLQASGPDRETLGMVALCGMFFVAHLATGGQRHTKAAHAAGQALADAQRARHRAESAEAAKNEFLAVISHELRTPLNGVLGMAQIMEGDDLNARQRDRLAVVRQSAETLLVLVNDLLDIARIEDESLVLDEGLIDLPQLAGQTETLFGPLAEVKGLDLRVRLMANAGVTRLGDPARVRQVLHNLVGNAIKFTDSGRVSLVISGTDDELVFDVVDTGPGVQPDRLAAIFDCFTQSDGSSSRRHGGSGLGLAITAGLARLMGGELSVRSQVGEGSTFTARLGLRLAQAALAPAPAAPAASARSEETTSLRVRILAAEDNPTNQLVLRTLLEQLGVRIQVVENGEEAVAAWRVAPWDLVLMDIQMPLMDGVAATRAIRQIEAAEGRARTPIIAVTANATAAQAAAYVAAGMDGLVPKPIQFAQLLAAISGAIEAENDNHDVGQAGVG